MEWEQAMQEARKSGKGEYSGALLQAALDKALVLSPEAHAKILYEEGRFNYYGARREEALNSYKQALASFKKIENYAGQAKVLQAIGDFQQTFGKLDDALDSYEKARALYRWVGKRSEEAKALEAMGDVQRLRYDLDAALQSYEQALALYQEEKDRLKRAKVLKTMGDVQQLPKKRNAVLKSYEQALESYGQALALFRELEEPAEEANVRRALKEIENDRDIYLTVMISPLEARTGIKREYKLLDGKQVLVSIPRGAYHGQEIRLEGHGRPATYNGPTGALIVTIAIILVEEGASQNELRSLQVLNPPSQSASQSFYSRSSSYALPQSAPADTPAR